MRFLSIIAAILFVPALLSLTACGGSEETPPPPTTTTIGATPASTPASSTPASSARVERTVVREVEVVRPAVVVESPEPAPRVGVVVTVPTPPSVTLHAPTPPHVEVH